MTNRYMGNIGENNVNHTQIHLGCRGYMGGRLGLELGCFGGLASLIVIRSIPMYEKSFLCSSKTYDPIYMQYMQHYGGFVGKMGDLGWLDLWA